MQGHMFPDVQPSAKSMPLPNAQSSLPHDGRFGILRGHCGNIELALWWALRTDLSVTSRNLQAICGASYGHSRAKLLALEVTHER